ncbi:Uncharacterised protein [Mycobacteroides abscessus subsp. abscessus]|nr:Uncharacterised protein [Mycobacteroides abscessus subsp. abscessus]
MNVHRGAGVGQRGVSAYGVSAADLFDGVGQFGQIVGPGAQTATLPLPCHRRSNGLTRGTREPLLQGIQILVACHLGAIGGFDDKGHPEMWRNLIQVECVGGHSNAAESMQFAS